MREYQKAKKILTNTFWSAKGWKSIPSTYAGDEFEYAKAHGVMFDPLSVTHDELIAQIRYLHDDKLTTEQAAAAFLHSLSTRKVELRSALSSFALTADLPGHVYSEQTASDHLAASACRICNRARLQSDREYVHHDLNVLNFERIKWGGVRHHWLTYVWMDLDRLSREEVHEVTRDDVDLLRSMLKAIDDCRPEEHARGLEKRWKDVFPSNQAERDKTMEVWAYAGILEETNAPRKGRRGDTDFAAVDGWQGGDGYSREAVERYFGKWL